VLGIDRPEDAADELVRSAVAAQDHDQLRGFGHVDCAAGVAVADAAVSAEAVRRLDQRRVEIAAIELQQPSLDDVFLALTGRPAEEGTPSRPQLQEAA